MKKQKDVYESLNALLKNWKQGTLTVDEKSELNKKLKDDIKFRRKVGDVWGSLVEQGMIWQLKLYKAVKNDGIHD